MADGTVYQPFPTQDGMFGGGTLGAVLLGSLLPRLVGNQGFGGGFGAGYGAEAAMGGFGGANSILQALNQQQLANSSQLITQDLGRNDRDILASSGTTQAAVASANLQQTISTLQGQTALTKDIMDSTMQNANGHTNIMSNMSGLAADLNSSINNATANINSNIHQTLDAVNTARLANVEATHRAEVSQLESAYRTLQAITTDGDRTRDLISNINTADLNRQITVAENKLAEALGDRRQAQANHDIIINNNNNANAVATAVAQQQQQQQLANISNGLAVALAHIQQTQTVVNTGTMRGNSLGQVAV